ncbi:hypothetical protein ILYODFUR_038850, partial [Ilyodon furcidens]
FYQSTQPGVGTTSAAAFTELPRKDTFMRTTKSRQVTSPGMAEPGSHPGARPGVGTRRRLPGGQVTRS